MARKRGNLIGQKFGRLTVVTDLDIEMKMRKMKTMAKPVWPVKEKKIMDRMEKAEMMAKEDQMMAL